MDKNIRFISISFKFIIITMEKRLFGVILTILGIAGLILAAYNFVQGNTDNQPQHPVCGDIWHSGLIFFLRVLV